MITQKTKTLALVGLVAASVAALYIQERVNEGLRAQLNRLGQINEQTRATNAKENRQAGVILANNKLLAEIVAHPGADFSLSKAHARMALRLRKQLPDDYAALFRRLKLSPDKQALFEKLILEKQASEIVIGHNLLAGVYPGLDPNDVDKLKTLTAAGTEDIDIQIQQVLGDSLYDQYTHYDDTLNSRQQVNAFAAQLKATSTPLSDAQTDQLVGLLVRTSSDPAAPLPDSFQAQAAAILSPSQLPAMKTFMAALQARRTILAMNQSAVANGTRPAAVLTGAILSRNLQQ